MSQSEGTPGRTRLPASESTALRLSRVSTVNSHPPDADCARRPLLSGARRCPRRYGGAASARAPYRDQTQHRPRDLRAPEALSPDRPASEPVCVCGNVALSLSGPEACRHRCPSGSINIFLLLHSGEEGWGVIRHACYVVVNYRPSNRPP
jgi:hypothetical protein